jgi:amidohydrolase
VPVTYNDSELTALLGPTLDKVYGATNVYEPPLVTGAEDFSFFQEQVPGFFFFIGARPLDVPSEKAIPNHSPYFYVDEGALKPGVSAMTQLALDFLQADQSGGE